MNQNVGFLLLVLVIGVLITTAIAEDADCGDGFCSAEESVETCFPDCAHGNDCLSCDGICMLEDVSEPHTTEIHNESHIPLSSHILSAPKLPLSQPERYVVSFSEEAPLDVYARISEELQGLHHTVSRLKKEQQERQGKGLINAVVRGVQNVQLSYTEGKLERVEKNVVSKVREHAADVKNKHSTHTHTIKRTIRKEPEREFTTALVGALYYLTPQEADTLRSLDFVTRVTPDTEINLSLMDSPEIIGAPTTWAQQITGEGVTIGIIDTGVDYTHPDLGGCLGEKTSSSSPDPETGTDGMLAWVAGRNGLRVFDVSDTSSPTLVASYTEPVDQFVSRSLDVVGSIVYLGADRELIILDASDINSIKPLGRLVFDDAVWKVVVDKKYAYVGMGQDGVHIVDVHDPSQPRIVGTYEKCDTARDIQVAEPLVYLACHESDSELSVIDVSDKTNPYHVSRGWTFGTAGTSILFQDGFSYLSTIEGDITMHNHSDRRGKSMAGAYQYYPVLGDIDVNSFTYDVAVVDGYILAATGSRVEAIDLSRLPLTYNASTYANPINGYAHGLELVGNKLFVAGEHGGLTILDARDPRHMRTLSNTVFDSAWDVEVTTQQTSSSAHSSSTHKNHITGLAVAQVPPALENTAHNHEFRRTLTPAEEERLLLPTEISYKGAFRLPASNQNEASRWGYGARSLTYYPGGDPAQTDGDTAYPGSLFGSGHVYHNLVAEASIPEPVISDNVNDYPRATQLQTFADITEGMKDTQFGNIKLDRFGGIAYLEAQPGQTSDKLYWSLFQYYSVQPASETDLPTFGMSNLDLTQPDAEGLWRIGEFGDSLSHTKKTSKYLFDVPKDFADQYLGGRYLIAGKGDGAGNAGNSEGPPMYAFAPYNEPLLVNKSELDYLQLVYYPRYEGHFPDWSACDDWNGGAWLTSGDKSAVIISGKKGLGEDYYGLPREGDCGSYKGYHCDPYEHQILFYDPMDIAAAAQGTKEVYEVVPYMVFKPGEYLLPGCSGDIDAVAFDRERGNLYVVQPNGENPVVHVFQITSTTSEPPPENSCGNGVCDANETEESCPEDCEPEIQYCKVMGGYDFVNNDDDPMDDHGHGTHCAGIAAGQGALKGVAPDAQVYAYKVLSSSGQGYASDVIAAIERSVDPNNDGNYTDHLDVISLSLGAYCGDSYSISCGPDDGVSQAIDAAVQSGVIAVVSAGNNGPGLSTIGSPGTARQAITVGASSKYESLASFSSRGHVKSLYGDLIMKPDVLAPGVSICSAKATGISTGTCFDSEHTSKSGTSMAAPHVAGAAALLRQQYPEKSPVEIKELLMQTSVDLGYKAYEQGTGRIDVARAVTPPATVTPARLFLGIPEEGTMHDIPFTVSIDSEQQFTFDAIARSDSDVSISILTNDLSTGSNSVTLRVHASSPILSPVSGTLYLVSKEDPLVTLSLPVLITPDFTPPVIEEHYITTVLDGADVHTNVKWKTDETTFGTVYYRPVDSDASFKTAESSGIEHRFDTSTLEQGTYEYYIQVRNLAGYTITDNNNGLLYHFVVQPQITTNGFSAHSTLPQAQGIFTTYPALDTDNDNNPEFIQYHTDSAVLYEVQNGVPTSVRTLQGIPVAAADTNHDGKDDVLLDMSSGSLVLYDSGDPATQSWQVAAHPIHTTMRDIDSDGNMDILYISGHTIQRYERSSQDVTLTQSISLISQPEGLAACGDVDNNGYEDVFISSSYIVYRYEVDDNGLLVDKGRVASLTNEDGNSLRIDTLACIPADNGRPGLVASGELLFFTDHKAYVNVIAFDASGSGRVRQKYTLSKGTSFRPAIGDVNGDGRKDLVLPGSIMYVFTSDKLGTRTATWGLELSNDPSVNQHIGVVNVDGDITDDIIALPSEATQTHIYASGLQSSFERYNYIDVFDNNCTASFTVGSFTGHHTFLVETTPNTCDETWNLNISTTEGHTETVHVGGLNAGKYAIKIAGIGAYALSVDTVCLDDINDPKISLAQLPEAARGEIWLIANVTDTNGLDYCDVCFSANGVCDNVWTRENVTLELEDEHTGVCSYLWDTTSFWDRNYSVVMRVHDIGGNNAMSPHYSVFVDNSGPNITHITTPATTETLQSFPITVSAYDLLGVANVRVATDHSNTVLQPNGTAFSGTITAPDQPGRATLTVTATDSLNNSQIKTHTIQVDERMNWSNDLMFNTVAPRVAVTGGEGIHLALEVLHNDRTNIHYTRFDSTGKIIEMERQLSHTVYHSTQPDIARDNLGRIHVVWSDERDGNREIYYSQLASDGSLVVSEQRMTTNTYASVLPRVFASEDSIRIVWIEGDEGINNVYTRTFDLNAHPLSATEVMTTTGDILTYDTAQNENELHLVTLNENGVIRLHREEETYTLGEGEDPSIAIREQLYIAFINTESNLIIGTIEEGTVQPRSILSETGYAQNPSLDVDSSGLLNVVWEDMIQGAQKILYTKLMNGSTPIVSTTYISDESTQPTHPEIALGSVHVAYTDSGRPVLKTTLLDTAAPAISEVEIQETSQDGVQIGWKTDEPATGIIYYGTQGVLQEEKREDSLGYEHSLRITDLMPDTEYVFAVAAEDVYHNRGYDNNTNTYYRATTLVERYKPVLPTSIYGKVVYQNGSVVTGVPVTATWIDAANITQQTITMTLSRREAQARNDSTLEGYFLFNEGRIRAKEGTRITVAVPNDVTQPDPFTIANPGGDALRVEGGPIVVDTAPPEITLVSPREGTYPSQNVSLQFTSNEPLSYAGFSLNGAAFVTVTDLLNESIPLAPSIGENTLELVARDSFQFETTHSVAFSVEDAIAPNVTVHAPGKANGIVLITAHVRDSTNTLAEPCERCISHEHEQCTQWTTRGVDVTFAPGNAEATCTYSWDTTAYPDSTYTLSFRMSDSTGNNGVGHTQTHVDNTPPATPVLQVNTVPGVASLALSWTPSTADDFAEYKVYRSLAPFTTINDASVIAIIHTQDSQSYVDKHLIEETTYHYAVTVSDTIGNEESHVDSVSTTVPDVTPPVVTIHEPLAHTYTTPNVTLAYTSSEEGTCEYNLNGYTAPASSPMLISGQEGRNTLTLSCADNAENIQRKNVSFSVDTTPPEPISDVSVSTMPGQNTLNVTWSTTSAHDFYRYDIYRDTVPFSQATGIPVRSVYHKDTTNVIDTGLTSSRSYYYAIVAMDAAGNVNTQVTTTAGTVADTLPPELIITSPENKVYTTDEITVSYSANEPVSLCTYSLNGEERLHATNGMRITAPEGVNSLAVFCSDAAENIGSRAIRFEVDTSTPTAVQGIQVHTVPGTNALDISWNASSERDVETYVIYRQREPFTSVADLTPVQTTSNRYIRDTGLESEMTYWYAVTAIDHYGNERQDVLSFSGTVADTLPPEPVTNISAQSLTDEDALVVTWTASSAEDFAAYHIYRRASPKTRIATLTDKSQTSYKDDGLDSGKTYYYQVTVADASGNENVQTEEVSATVRDTEPPEIILVEPRATTYTTNTVSVVYSVNEPVASCTMTHNDDTIDAAPSLSASDGAHSLYVSCTDSAGNTGNSDTVPFNVDTTGPAPVDTLVVSQVEREAALALTWQSSPETDFDHYEIYRDASAFSDVAFRESIATTEATHYEDISVQSDDVWHYAVVGVDIFGNAQTNVVSVSGIVDDVIAPPAPANVAVSERRGENTLLITWDESSAGDTEGYRVFRSSTSFSDTSAAELIATTTANQHIDRDLDSGQTYWYAIAAYDERENMLTTVNAVSGTVADTLAPSIRLISPENTTYNHNSPEVIVESNEATSWCGYTLNDAGYQSVDTPLIAHEGSNTIRAACNDTSGNTGFSALRSFSVDTTPPGPVTGLHALFDQESLAVHISWDAHTEDMLEGYYVYRSTQPFSDTSQATLLAHVTEPNYVDDSVQSLQTYYYAVAAIDAAFNERTDVTTVTINVPDIIPPTIVITEPQNKPYGTQNITLVFTVNEETDGCTAEVNAREAISAVSGMTLSAEEGTNTLRVQCVDAAGNTGEATQTFSVDLAPPAPVGNLRVEPVAGEGSLRITWDTSPESDLAHYAVYKSENTFSDVSGMHTIAKPTTTTVVDTLLESEATYYYAVTAIDQFDNEDTDVTSVMGTVADFLPPDPVSTVSFFIDEQAITVDVMWNMSDASDVASYNVYRADSVFTAVDQATRVSNTTDQKYKDDTVKDGKTYWYAISTIDNAGNENTDVSSHRVALPDISAPSIEVIDLGEEVSGIVTLTAYVSDSGSGIHSCAVCVSPGESCTDWLTEDVVLSLHETQTSGSCSYTWDTSDLTGMYTYNFMVSDNANHTRTGQEHHATVQNTSTALQTYTLHLESGWNLISLPLEPTNPSIAAVFEGLPYKRIYQYDAQTKGWHLYNPNPSVFDQENSLFALHSGRAYWVEMTRAASLTLIGRVPQSFSRTLQEGWNFIGLPGRTSQPFSAVLNDASYHRIFAYDATQQRWEMYSPYTSSYVTSSMKNMTPGRGYVLDARNEFTWSP